MKVQFWTRFMPRRAARQALLKRELLRHAWQMPFVDCGPLPPSQLPSPAIRPSRQHTAAGKNTPGRILIFAPR
jgi:hypothetical protein